MKRLMKEQALAALENVKCVEILVDGEGLLLRLLEAETIRLVRQMIMRDMWIEYYVGGLELVSRYEGRMVSTDAIENRERKSIEDSFESVIQRLLSKVL